MATKMIGRTSPAPLIGKAVVKRKKRKPSVAKKMVSRRRKKMGGIKGELPKMLEMGLAAAAGGFAGKVILKMGFLKPTATSSTDYRPYVAVIGGVATMVMSKSPIVKAGALGLTAIGAMGLVPDKDIPQIGSSTPNLVGRAQLIRLKGGRVNGNRRMIAGNANSVSPLIGKTSKKFYSGGIGLDGM
jgi:hypothetical protein